MHLRAIKIRGFKSFPDAVEVRLEPGVSVVVGPNGSGKSNIADALVWAAGTLAPADLRAEKPDDVLFAGAAGRAAAESCEVELLFDNTDGGLELDYSEVSVARRLHRGGEGQYLVNGATVRRLDVLELLADIGLGAGAGSVVGQGRVEAVLASKPEERRALVEEAAGLGKFKRRRHRAELKLARVATQAERARDVEAEVAKRLRPLALQATAAERAERLAAEIAGLRAGVASRDLAELAERRRAVGERQAASRRGREEADGRLESVLARRAAAEEELADAAGSREEATAVLYRLRGECERLGLRREAAQTLRDALGAELEAARSASPALLLELERTAAAAEAAAAAASLAASRAFAALAGAERAAEASVLERIGAALEERAALEGRLADAAAGAGAGLLNRLRGCHERLAVRQEAVQATLRGVQRDLAEAREWAAAGGPTPDELEAAAQEAEGERRRTESERDRLAHEARAVRERLAALVQALAEREGIPPAARHLAEQGEALALSLLQVHPGFESAVAAALAWRASAVVADGPARGLALLERARAQGLGSLTVLAGTRPPGSEPVRGARPLGEVVDGERRLVEGIWLVEADRLLAATHGVVVTTEGVGYDADRGELWLTSGTPEGLLLELEARRRRLELEAARLEREAALAVDVAAAAAARAAAAEAAYAEVAPQRRRRSADPGRLARIEAGLVRLDAALERASTYGAALDGPLAEGEAARARAAAELGERLRALGASEQVLRGEAACAGERAGAAERRAEQFGAAAGPAAAGDAEGLRSEAERLAGEAAVARTRQHETAAVFAEARRAAPRASAALLEELAARTGRLEGQLGRALVEAARFEPALRANVEAGASRVTELGAELQRLGAEEVEARRAASEAAARLSGAEVELARLEGEAIEAGRRLAEAAAEPAQGERAELAERLERLERRREQLGGVNPFAKEEYAQEKARLAELSGQREDLERSLAELEGLRDDLAATVERRFAETFTSVERNFAEVAATLFPGGEGRLRLSEAHEDGEQGIEVELRPAGKKVTRLSLLSGGEKALGAIAFLFALFLARPCPFYLLDEVEAALDDTNIGRFVDLLRTFSDRAQFVVVTHQKRTMEAADLLYGVTMGGDGVSQIVSRRLPRVAAVVA